MLRLARDKCFTEMHSSTKPEVFAGPTFKAEIKVNPGAEKIKRSCEKERVKMRHFPRALLPLLAAGAKVSLRIGDFSSEEADGDKALGDEAIMTGTDDTSERAVAYYGDIVFRKAGS